MESVKPGRSAISYSVAAIADVWQIRADELRTDAIAVPRECAVEAAASLIEVTAEIAACGAAVLADRFASKYYDRFEALGLTVDQFRRNLPVGDPAPPHALALVGRARLDRTTARA